MIVVVDSGVWISALQFEGTPLLAIERVLGHHHAAFCDPIIFEIRSGLMRKFGWSRAEVEEVLDFYFSRAIQVEVSGRIHGICRDPKDEMLLECAAVSGAEAIVSGDKDLLVLDGYSGIRIVTPRGFLDLPATSTEG